MTCVVCKSELVEEIRKIDPNADYIGGYPTGYSICPKCRIVYKEGE